MSEEHNVSLVAGVDVQVDGVVLGIFQHQVFPGETDALREVLTVSLPRIDVEDMTTVAIECAKAVRASFAELYGVSTPAGLYPPSSQPS